MRGLAALVVTVLVGIPAIVPAAPTPVQVQMRNIALHVDATTVVTIVQLRGELISTSSTKPPVFDDRDSFKVRVDSAEIWLDAKALTQLLNRYTFAYKGAPLRDVEVTTENQALKVSGELRKGIPVPFSITADPSVAGGQLRLHPTKVKALGVPAKRLMALFGLELDNLIKLREDRGARIEGDDFLLDPGALLPPPSIEGRLQSVHVEGGRIVQRYGPGRLPALKPPDPSATNYMYYSGGVLKFGKLTMTDTDMQLIDENPRDPFDFFQERYNDQLVAGYSKNTAAHGLKVYMPDYHRVAR